MTLLDQYAQQFQADRERLYRAWRVCYAFDRFDLFDAIVSQALAEGDPADWSPVFELASDAAIEP
jgi:hypothetical protein